MAIDYTKAFEVSQNGVQIENGSLFLSGVGSPLTVFSAINIPIGAFYVNKSDGEAWKKTGTGITDWVSFTTNILSYPRLTLP